MTSIRKTKKLLKNSRELRMVTWKDKSPLVFSPYGKTFIQENQRIACYRFGVTVMDDNGIPYEYVPYRKIHKVTFETKWWNSL